jgi:hypothetical protein
MDIIQPAPGAAKMGHLMRAVRVTGFVIKWGAHLATLAAGVWMLHGMVVIKIQADKIVKTNHVHKREDEGEEMMEIYKRERAQDDALLMDVYSFPGYQVEVEVETNADGSSNPVILDEALKGVMDPVLLGRAGVSVYEIPAEKTKTPVDEWVDVEDLGVDENDYPNDTDPVAMATPAPDQKVWLATDINRVSSVPYAKAVTTADWSTNLTEPAEASTAETPKRRPTKRQGRSFLVEGGIIAEANVGTIPYMTLWVRYVYFMKPSSPFPAYNSVY